MVSLSFHVGVPVILEEFLAAIHSDGQVRVARVDRDKIILVDFVSFQYGELSDACKPHKKVIARLKKLNLLSECSKGIRYPLERVQEEEEDTDKDKEKEKEKEKEGSLRGFSPPIETFAPHRPAPLPIDRALGAQIEEAAEVFRETLRHFGQGRSLLGTEKLQIGRAIQQHGLPAVKLVLVGAKHDPGSEKFRPADWVDLNRYLSAKNFQRLLGYGARKAHEEAVS
jgi:hypothetical protein